MNTTDNDVSIWSAVGRSQRQEYFVTWLVCAALSVPAYYAVRSGGFVTLLGAVVLVLLTWVHACAAIRRFHDLNRSGWMFLLMGVPIINLVMQMYLWVAPSHPGDTEYGPGQDSQGPNNASDSVSRSAEPLAQMSAGSPMARNLVEPGGRLDASGRGATDEGEDEALWEMALCEVEGGQRRAGLWAKSFAQNNGDEGKAKAAYLAQRVREMQAEQQKEIDASRALETDAESRLIGETNEDVLAAFKRGAKPKGGCPSCNQLVFLHAKFCPHCSADFGPNSSWKPGPLRKHISQSDIDASEGVLKSTGYSCAPYKRGKVISAQNQPVQYAFTGEDLYGMSLLAKKKKPLSLWADSIS